MYLYYLPAKCLNDVLTRFLLTPCTLLVTKIRTCTPELKILLSFPNSRKEELFEKLKHNLKIVSQSILIEIRVLTKYLIVDEYRLKEYKSCWKTCLKLFQK